MPAMQNFPQCKTSQQVTMRQIIQMIQATTVPAIHADELPSSTNSFPQEKKAITTPKTMNARNAKFHRSKRVAMRQIIQIIQATAVSVIHTDELPTTFRRQRR
jgi:hypothetical protein